ncbi:hypothetical protein AVEN_267677-2 [Araneus ventricosus]|uniref:Uncharacterized protein n=1 Tax=Araneus ventricosus TaxID=182803 RepID=A0A4Y2VKX9_ARAVE|nr:hypothetical protein AVEN_267677-2 [Araneus ventricosus]
MGSSEVDIGCGWILNVRTGRWLVAESDERGQAVTGFGWNQRLNTQIVLKLRESDPTYYSNMLKQVGFLVLFCREQIIEYVFHDDEEYKGNHAFSEMNQIYNLLTEKNAFLDGVWDSAFLENIPRELQDEFVEETFSTFLALHPRNEAGNLNFKYVMIEVLVEKDDETVETP